MGAAAAVSAPLAALAAVTGLTTLGIAQALIAANAALVLYTLTATRRHPPPSS